MSHRPVHRNAQTIEHYVDYVPPTIDSMEDAERGLSVPYEDRWADELFTWLSSGRSLLAYCEQPSKPARSLVLGWLANTEPLYDHLRDCYARGTVNRSIALVDDSADIAEEPLVMGPRGFLDPTSMADKKARVDAKLRLAALLNPGQFSPTSKVAQQVALTQVNLTLTSKNVVDLTDEQLKEFIEAAERKRNNAARAATPAVVVDVPQLEGPPKS